MGSGRTPSGSAKRLSIDEPELDRGNHRLDLGAGSEPLVDRSNVRTDGIHAQVERDTDVVVAVAVGQQLQDLSLAAGEQAFCRRRRRAYRSHRRGTAARATEHE